MKKAAILSFLVSIPIGITTIIAVGVTLLATAKVINPDLSLESMFQSTGSEIMTGVEPEVKINASDDVKTQPQ